MKKVIIFVNGTTVNNRPNIETLKSAVNLRIIEYLKKLGFIDIIDRYGYLTSCCLHYGADNNTAFSYHLTMKIWSCFTHHCEKKYGSDIIGLTRFALAKMERPHDFKSALQFIIEFLEQDTDKIDVKNRDFLLNLTKKTALNKIEKKYKDDILKKLKPHSYLIKRGFKNETIAKYQIGYCDNKYKKFYNRIVIPVRNCTGELVGFTARWIGDHAKTKVPKWLHSNGFKKGEHLFNLNNALPYIRKNGEVIIVEGCLDSIKLDEIGISNSVAIFGTSLSSTQKSIILGNATSVIIVFDNDAAGIVAQNVVTNSLKNYVDVYAVTLPKGKDIDDLSECEIKKYISERIRL